MRLPDRPDCQTWEVTEIWREAVLGFAAPPWANLYRDGRARLIKKNARREVWRVELAAGHVIAKIYVERNWRNTLRRWVRGSDAAREWRAACRASALGLSAPPIGHGEVLIRTASNRRRGRHISVFLTPHLGGARPLSQVWKSLQAGDDGLGKRRTDALIRSLARFVSQAHAAGFFHADSHPNNILVTERTDGAYQCVYIDLAGARFDLPATDDRKAANLAALGQWFTRHATLTQRWRFLLHYLGDDPSMTRAARRAFARRIQRRAAEHARRLFAKRDRRIFSGQNRQFSTLHLGGGWTARAVLRLHHGHEFPVSPKATWHESDWRAVLAVVIPRLEHVADERVPTPGADSAATDDAIIVEAADGVSYEVKRRLPTGRLAGFVEAWAGHPQRRAFMQAHRLRHRDIPCHCPVALLERWSGMRLTVSALVSTSIAYARFSPVGTTLSETVARPAVAPDADELPRFLRSLGGVRVNRRDLPPADALVLIGEPRPRIAILGSLLTNHLRGARRRQGQLRAGGH